MSYSDRAARWHARPASRGRSPAGDGESRGIGDRKSARRSWSRRARHGQDFASLVPALLSGKRVLHSPARARCRINYSTRTCRWWPAPSVFLHAWRCSRGVLTICAPIDPAARRPESLAGARDRTLTRVERWAGVTKSGDLSEVPDLSDAHPLWPQDHLDA
jgi:hypothetical protein